MEFIPGFPMEPGRAFLFFLAVVWSMVWKGIALWRVGRNSHLIWFVVLFIVNTLGILEIVYILRFSRKK